MWNRLCSFVLMAALNRLALAGGPGSGGPPFPGANPVVIDSVGSLVLTNANVSPDGFSRP